MYRPKHQLPKDEIHILLVVFWLDRHTLVLSYRKLVLTSVCWTNSVGDCGVHNVDGVSSVERKTDVDSANFTRQSPPNLLVENSKWEILIEDELYLMMFNLHL